MDERDRDKADKDRPSDDKKIAREGDKKREETDEVPEPGTEPLYEGP